MDPELFFPIGSSGPALLQIEAAKAVCRGCVVVEECRAYALANPHLVEDGVWGGMSKDERATELRRRRRRGGASGWRHEPGVRCPSSGPVLAVLALPPGVLRVFAGGDGMRRKRELVAAGVIRAGRRHDALPAGTRRPVEGVNLLDTPLGVAGGTRPAPLRAIAEPEPDLSARYRVPSRPAEPVDRVRAGRALARALQGLDLDHDSFRLLTWVDSWSAADKAALASLVEAARTAGVAR